MFNLTLNKPEGVLSQWWSTAVGDYAIAGGWTKQGQALIVGDAAGGVSVFDGETGATIWTQPHAHEGGILAVEVHPKEAKFATSGQDGRVLIWEVSEGQVGHTVEVGRGWVDNLLWSRDGRWLAASCSRKVYIYGADGAEIWRSDDHPSTVSALACSKAGELATACYGQVAFFDGSTGTLCQKLEWKGSLVSMVLSPNGDVVACGSQDNTVHFWRRSTGEDSMMSGYRAKPSVLAFDANGTLLATGGGESATVWNFKGRGPEGSWPGVLEFHLQPITTLTFASHGRVLASGSRDGSVAVWSLNRHGEGNLIGSALVADKVDKLYWQSGGSVLAGLDGQGGVTVWRVSH